MSSPHSNEKATETTLSRTTSNSESTLAHHQHQYVCLTSCAKLVANTDLSSPIHKHKEGDTQSFVDQAEEDLVLPTRQLTNSANLDEYRRETTTGTIIAPRVSRADGHTEKYKLVTFTVDDPANPKNWSKLKKWWITGLIASVCFTVAFNSAVITADIGGPAGRFGVSEETALLSVTLFVVGFGIGPMFFAPLSELYGRRIMYVSTLLIGIIFIIPCAVAQNIGTLLVCRFIDGIGFR